MSFAVYTLKEAKKLDIIWPDIYVTPKYGQLFKNKEELRYCVYKGGKIIYVYLEIPCEKGYHLETPYGYGSLYVNKWITIDQLNEFVSLFRSYATNNKYIKEYIRFPPYIYLFPLLSNFYDIEINRSTYSIQTLDPDKYLKQLSSKQRNMISKAIREKVDITFDLVSTKSVMNDFKRLYYKTMDKHEANEFYYFDDDYFNKLQNIPNTYIVTARDKEDNILTMAIFFVYPPYGHYHLSCRGDKQVNYAQTYLFYEVVSWLSNKDIELIHLGGGREEGDSLSKFKERISDTEHNYYISDIKL